MEERKPRHTVEAIYLFDAEPDELMTGPPAGNDGAEDIAARRTWQIERENSVDQQLMNLAFSCSATGSRLADSLREGNPALAEKLETIAKLGDEIWQEVIDAKLKAARGLHGED